MVVTAKTTDGKEIGKVEKHYHPQATNCRDTKMKYGAQWKVANVRDTSLQPAQAKKEDIRSGRHISSKKKEAIEFDLPAGIREAIVTVELFYEAANPANKYQIHSITRKVSLDR